MNPIMLVAGTRPEIIKLAPVIKWLKKLNVSHILVWSGQHYDYELSRIFFEEFKVQEPDENLEVKSGTHAEQTARCMLKLERVIKKRSPSVVVAEGDTNTVAATSLTSIKCLIPFAHVEAGLRSWNMTMPEEINRKITDAVATLHFAPTELASINLAFEGISNKSVYVTGNTIVDVIYEYRNKFLERTNDILAQFDLLKDEFILLTLHRAENTENKDRLKSILKAIEEISRHYPILFAMHPRTKKLITKLGLLKCLNGIRLTKPLGYFDFLALLASCRVVLTDSGGVQEEAFTLKTPTVTLRYNTERPETTMFGVNVLAGSEKKRIIDLTNMQAGRFEDIKKLEFQNPLGDGFAGKRIAEILKEVQENDITLEEPDLRDAPKIDYRLLDRITDDKSLFDLLTFFTKEGRPAPPSKDNWRTLARIKGRMID